MSDGPGGKKRKSGKKEKPTPKTPKRQASEEPKEQVPLLTDESYKKKKMDLLKVAVICERSFTGLKTELKEAKVQQVIDYKKTVAKDECPIFIEQKKAAEELMEKKRNINFAYRQLKLAQISDEFEAETHINKTQFDDQIIYAKERYIEFFKELLEEKKRRKKDIDAILPILLEMPPLPNETNTRPVHTATVTFEGRQTRSRSLAIAQEQKREIAVEKSSVKKPSAKKQQRKKRPV